MDQVSPYGFRLLLNSTTTEAKQTCLRLKVLNEVSIVGTGGEEDTAVAFAALLTVLNNLHDLHMALEARFITVD